MGAGWQDSARGFCCLGVAVSVVITLSAMLLGGLGPGIAYGARPRSGATPPPEIFPGARFG
jgi:hypothetical protein